MYTALDGGTSARLVLLYFHNLRKHFMNYYSGFDNGQFGSLTLSLLLQRIQILEKQVQNLEEEFRFTVTSAITENQELKYEAYYNRFTGEADALEDLRQKYED